MKPSPPQICSVLLVLIGAVWFGIDLGGGSLQRYDEFYTALRTLSFVESSDWFSITTNYEPVFKKPPLQYMLGALLLNASVPLELALRIWPFLFTICGLWLAGSFARLLAEGEPWSRPLAITLVMSSAQVWSTARSAMLDSGQSFFLLAALYSMFRASKNPHWWIATGIMLGLGALQKAPIGLLAVVVILASSNRFGGPLTFRLRSLLYDRSFRRSVGIFAFLFLTWPVIQVSRFGWDFITTFFGKQMISRFKPGSDVDFHWIGWLTEDNSIVGLLYLVGLVLALTLPRFRGQMAVRSTALFLVLACVALTLASGKTYGRHLIPLIPLFAAVLSAVLVKLLPKAAIATTIGAALLALQTPTLSKIPESIYWRDQSDIRKASKLVAAQLRDTESPVFVNPFRFAHFPPGAFILYADIDRHVLISRWDHPEKFTQKAKQHAALPPYMGVAHHEHLSIVEEMVGSIQVIARINDWIIWRQHDPKSKMPLDTTDGIRRDN